MGLGEGWKIKIHSYISRRFLCNNAFSPSNQVRMPLEKRRGGGGIDHAGRSGWRKVSAFSLSKEDQSQGRLVPRGPRGPVSNQMKLFHCSTVGFTEYDLNAISTSRNSIQSPRLWGWWSGQASPVCNFVHLPARELKHLFVRWPQQYYDSFILYSAFFQWVCKWNPLLSFAFRKIKYFQNINSKVCQNHLGLFSFQHYTLDKAMNGCRPSVI